jgi:hypothetical protein
MKLVKRKIMMMEMIGEMRCQKDRKRWDQEYKNMIRCGM